MVKYYGANINKNDGGICMEKHEQINTVLGIALLFTIITSIFSLPKSFITLILLTNGGLKNAINIFIQNNILFIIVMVLIIISLIVYIKKSNEIGYLVILRNENVRLITGVLVALQGVMELSSLLPTYIMTIQPLLKMPHSPGDNIEVLSRRIITVDVVSVAIILCQVFVGVYLAKYYKKKIN